MGERESSCCHLLSGFIRYQIITNDLNVTLFEHMKMVINKNHNIMRLAVVYRPGHPGIDQIFMDEFDSFMESFSSRNGKLLICWDFKYWVDDPANKPYSSEIMELFNLWNFENHVFRPTHTSGHTLDLVLSPGDSGVDDLNVLPISSTSDHYTVFFCATFQNLIPLPNLSYLRNIKE